MPKSKSLIGQAINMILDDGDDQTVREQKIDGSSLPDFEEIRKYLGTVGVGMQSLDEGWYITGFSLPRHTEAAAEDPDVTDDAKPEATDDAATEAEEKPAEKPEAAEDVSEDADEPAAESAKQPEAALESEEAAE